jgi:hypothetical protein
MGQLLKLNCAYSPLNLRILSTTSVPFTLTTVQVPNLALIHKKRITVWWHEINTFQVSAVFYYTVCALIAL